MKNNKTLFRIISTLAVLFVSVIIFAILFRDLIRDYGAVVSLISTVMILCVNITVISINLQNLDFSQKPVVVLNFRKINDKEGMFCFRNIGNSAAIVKCVDIDKKWLEEFLAYNPQISEDEKKFMRELIVTHIVLPPDEEISIRPLIQPQRIIDAQHDNKVKIKLIYENIAKRGYEKTIIFDFAQYNDMIVYHRERDFD